MMMSSSLWSQEKPIRVGVKLGFPNIVGANSEYVLPVAGNKLAPTLDFSTLKLDRFIDPDQASFRYLGGGLNYYFFKEGKGPYGHLGYGSFKFDLVTMEDEFEGRTATSSIDDSFNSLMMKVGAKWGKGFYFRPEVGLALSGIPDSLDKRYVFRDGSSATEKVELGTEMPKAWLFNIGFGVAF
ncbi:hypothetical protein LPB144_00975 [Christiangramia salexigens]|uniref:Outer membrane protein beta-barrel domain-containing protein n=2 Tax=Christiangramia salexigens TaxID=1913577 RepID=A0A1L3J1R1_9FLAO|nr:hypothetical protein LPB144_00975 [Christiangramia salexigens]